MTDPRVPSVTRHDPNDPAERLAIRDRFAEIAARPTATSVEVCWWRGGQRVASEIHPSNRLPLSLNRPVAEVTHLTITVAGVPLPVR